MRRAPIRAGQARRAGLTRDPGETGARLDARAVPAEAPLAGGHGFRHAKKGLDGARRAIAPGGARAARDTALAHTGGRRAFGRAIRDVQAVRFRLADMETGLQAARVFPRGRRGSWTGAPPTPPSVAP